MKSKLVILLVIQIILVQILGFFPDFVEQWYSKGLYLKISFINRNLLGGIPFSVGDVLYFGLIILFIRWIWKNRKGFFDLWKANLLNVLSWFSIIYFLFHFLWGFNYYRLPLHQKLYIDKEYSKEQLEQFLEKMLVKTNAIHIQLTKDSSQKVVVPYSDEEIFRIAMQGYAKLPKSLQDYTYETKSVKKSLFSYPLSYMGFGGYMNPFTGEAQVNYLKPKYTSPMTTCHEMAHQTGIGSESECNFIGFVTATLNDDLYFQYSAYSFALRYGLRNLEVLEHGSSEKYSQKINQGILKNFEENELFWKQYQTPINTFFETFYDNFLKLNQQKDGMEGYSKFVGLVIGFEKVGSGR